MPTKEEERKRKEAERIRTLRKKRDVQAKELSRLRSKVGEEFGVEIADPRIAAEEAVTNTLRRPEYEDREPLPEQREELTQVALQKQEAIARERREGEIPPTPTIIEEGVERPFKTGERPAVAESEERFQARLAEDRFKKSGVATLAVAEATAKEVREREVAPRPITGVEVQAEEAVKRELVTSTSTTEDISRIATDILAGRVKRREDGKVITEELGDITITTPAQLSLITQMKSGDSRVRERAGKIWEERGYGAIPTSQVFGAGMTRLEQEKYELGTMTPRERKVREENKTRIEKALRVTRKEKAKEERALMKEEKQEEREQARLGVGLRNLATYLSIAGVLDPTGKLLTPEQEAAKRKAEQENRFREQIAAISPDLAEVPTEIISPVMDELGAMPADKLAIDNAVRTAKYANPYELASEIFERLGKKLLPDLVPLTTEDIESRRERVRDQIADGKTAEEVVEQATREEKDEEQKPKVALATAIPAMEATQDGYTEVAGKFSRAITDENVRNDATSTAEMQGAIATPNTYDTVMPEMLNVLRRVLIKEEQYGITPTGRAVFAQKFPRFVAVRNRIATLGKTPSQDDVDQIALMWMIGKHENDPAFVRRLTRNFELARTGGEVNPDFLEARNAFYQTFIKGIADAILRKEKIIQEDAEKGLMTVWDDADPYKEIGKFANDSRGRERLAEFDVATPEGQDAILKTESIIVSEKETTRRRADKEIVILGEGRLPILKPIPYLPEKEELPKGYLMEDVRPIMRMEWRNEIPKTETDWTDYRKRVDNNYLIYPDDIHSDVMKATDEAQAIWEAKDIASGLKVPWKKVFEISSQLVSPIAAGASAIWNTRRAYDALMDEVKTKEAFPTERAITEPEVVTEELEQRTDEAVVAKQAEAKQLEQDGWQPFRQKDGSVVLRRQDKETGKWETQPWGD